MRTPAEILHQIHPPDKRNAIPYLKLKLSLDQLRNIAMDVTPGKKAPFSQADVQNWVKRGFLAKENRGAKQYTATEAANLLLFADLKNVVGLEGASQLLNYLNGDPNTETDDLIQPGKLYEHYAQVYASMADIWKEQLDTRLARAKQALESESLTAENLEKVASALVVVTLVAQANYYREMALEWIDEIREQEAAATQKAPKQ